MTTPMRDRLPRRVLAALAAPSIPLSALSLPVVAFLPEYYTGTLRLDLSMVGTVFMIVRLIDIAFDPIMGGIMDRTTTRFGHYRPWMLVAVPPIVAGIAMLFMAKPGVGPVYLTVWLLAAYAGWSMLMLAQLSLAANVSPDYHERSRIYGWWQVASFMGLIGSMLMPKLTALAGATSPTAGMVAMAWLVIVMTPLMAGAAAGLVRERPRADRHRGGRLADYFELLRSATVRRLIACEALMGLASGCTSTLALFFFTRDLGLAREDVGLLLIGQFAAGLACTPAWAMLANRIGKHRALALAAILYAAMQSLFLLMPAGATGAALLVQSLAGITYGATSALPRAMMADIADEERLRTGQERTGLLYALLIGVLKIGQALSVGVMFYALAFVGFDPKPGAANPGLAMAGLSILYIVVPALLSVAAAMIAWRYPLTPERHRQIRLQLETAGIVGAIR